MTDTIRLGFVVGSGEPVDIPLKHLAICGQTQEAGKTTALDALITRSGRRALTFVTKRGESAFTGARRIGPYFREQTDWQAVAAILEASRGEKMRFERSWIIRASRGARTLADVQANVRTAMKKAHGLAADVYLTLDAYLDDVVPAIGRVRWAERVDLAPGVNVMDLGDLSVEMQHLVIKSSIEWIHREATDVVVVIPEAWKFIPQGRSTPVKLAAVSYIRQGAALRNYLWLDSQDLGGIDKELLRSVAVWLLGVQREANEIKRTLANIPATVAKPKAADIATLELGQFLACWGKHVVRTYVQPAWVQSDSLAQQVARGELAAGQVQRTLEPIHAKETQIVTHEEAARIERENQQLRSENADLRRRLEALERGQHADQSRGQVRNVLQSTDGLSSVRHQGSKDDVAPVRTAGATNGHVDEATYQAIKARLLNELPAEPALLRVLQDRPELEVKRQRRTIEVDGDTLKGRLAGLIADGFFDQPRKGYAAFTELQRLGGKVAKPGVYNMCDALAKESFLTKEGDGYQAVAGMKVHIVEA